MKEKNEFDAWTQGYVACGTDKAISQNPFEKNTKDYKDWIEGWEHYDADYNSEYYSHRNAIRQGWI